MEDFKLKQTGQEVQSILDQSIVDAGDVALLKEKVGAIEEKIPDDASAENKLADKNYVDSSIAGTADDLTGMIEQKADAEDVYTKTQVYTKTEVNNLVTTPDQQYVSVAATEETTDVLQVLPETGVGNTIYRVGSWDGEQYDPDIYSEYAWDGTNYVLLNVKDNGIDDTPTVGSKNLVESGGVKDAVNDIALKIGESESFYMRPNEQFRVPAGDYKLTATKPDESTININLRIMVDGSASTVVTINTLADRTVTIPAHYDYLYWYRGGSDTTDGNAVATFTLQQNIKTDIAAVGARVGYYESSTASGTAAKTVTASDYVLTAGGSMHIKFNNGNSASNVTLNINGTGAKPLYYNFAAASGANSWKAGEVLEVFYDGTSYYATNLKNQLDDLSKYVSDVVNDVVENDSIPFKVETLDTPLSGYYYDMYGELQSNGDSRYYQPIDISAYANKDIELNFYVDSIPSSTDSRFCLITDANGGYLFRDRLSTNAVYVSEHLYVLKFGIIPDGAKYLKLSFKKDIGGQTLKYTKSLNPPIEDEKAPVYVDPASGSDENAGTKASPFKTIAHALTVNKEVYLKDGVYGESGITMVDGAKIKAVNIGKAIFMPTANKVIEADGTLMSGSEKVYQVSVTSTMATKLNGHRFIYQYGVDDPLTEIDGDFRLPIHGDKQYRCDFTAIKRLTSAAAVEESEQYAFYVDTTNNILYYSRPEAVSESNFIFQPSNTALFSSVANKTFELAGMRIYSLVLQLSQSINAKVEDCQVFACGGGGCICFDQVNNLQLIRCEAARGETNASNTTGDGFNSHGNSVDKNKSVFSLIECWAHDNYNDGYSDHELSEGTLIGGVYEYNCVGGHGGGLTPAFGAKDTIRDVICQKNAYDGLTYVGAPSATYTTYGGLVVEGVLCRSNHRHGVNVDGNSSGKIYVTLINSLAYDNEGKGFVNVDEHVTCINCKAVGNLQGDFDGCTNR